ncbi:PAS domain-containing sensor histidine kinase [Arthrobacter gengyunqii]|uniref:Sensor-like histidine kinase SenX3 n=1 Tax=Arthrobacter gengyunqii TaxID=2886940 RepID=A0ABS8GDN8_9MICC|nr:PAS domain S-box protein [Arthrobacter gengyunqii]
MDNSYEAHFHAAASGYLVLATDGTILDVNRTLVSWTGHSRDGLIGGNIVDLLPVGDRFLFASHAAPQLAVSGCFNEMAVELLSADGKRIPALLSGVRSEGDDGGLDRISVFNASERRSYEQELLAALRKAEAAEASRAAVEAELRENQRELEEKDRILEASLAESRKREALLATVLDTADVGLLVLGEQGEVVLTNAHLVTIWRAAVGNASVAEMQQLVYRPDRETKVPIPEQPFHRAADGESFSNEVIWLAPGSDKQMAVGISARPIRTDGIVSGSVLALNDVTRLVQAVAAQEEFVASVSHELRTPLTSILGYLDLALEDETLSPHVSTVLGVALRNSERLLSLVSDLLSVASGSKKMERRPVNLAEIVRAGLVSVTPKARANAVALEEDLPACLTVEVDPQRLAQVVDNLLSNAVKYSPDGGTVSVRLRQERESIRLTVSDTGIGMSPAEREQVFTKFFRSRRAVASAVPGVGLGLVITKNIVEDHGGELTFISEPGRGSTFSVTLPVR